MKDPISYAKQYLEDLLTFFGLNVDVRATKDDEVIGLSVPSTHLNGFLIGQRGETLRSIQFLVSSALRSQDFELTRVNVDIADYKRHRHERLAQKAEGWIEEIVASKEPRHMQPMNPADRRVLHKVVSDTRGVTSASEGEGRDRHVVITPIQDDVSEEEE